MNKTLMPLSLTICYIMMEGRKKVMVKNLDLYVQYQSLKAAEFSAVLGKMILEFLIDSNINYYLMKQYGYDMISLC